MNLINLFDSRKTTRLFGLKNYFNQLKELQLINKLPRVLLLTGSKGIGKSTLVNHFMNFCFNKEYDENNNFFDFNNEFYNQYLNGTFQNIIYLNGTNFKNIKVDDIRNLKKELLKTPINDEKRFIIFDEIEIFNTNSLNALLKIIEEPTKNNYFILINNESKKLLDTIKSRSLEMKIILTPEEKRKISDHLTNYFKQKNYLDFKLMNISPGNYIRFNYFFLESKININDKYLLNLKLILEYFKKEKDIFYKDLILFYTDYYLYKIYTPKIKDNINLIYYRSVIFKKINEFFIYNLNQNTLLNSLEGKLFNE